MSFRKRLPAVALLVVLLAAVSTSVQAQQTITEWRTTTPLPQSLPAAYAVTYGDHIIVASQGRSVFVGDVQPSTGEILRWRPTLSLPDGWSIEYEIARIGDYVVLPGYPISSVARLNHDGTLQEWQEAPGTNAAVWTERGVTTDGDRIYVAGGGAPYKAFNDVEMATLSPNGTLSSWTRLRSLPIVIHHPMASVFGGYLYVFGGEGVPPSGNTAHSRDVYRAAILTDGTIGAWELRGWMLDIRPHSNYLRYGNDIHVIAGGVHSNYRNTVESATLDDFGITSRHQWSAPLPNILNQFATAVVRNYGYVMGGTAGLYGRNPQAAVHVTTLGPSNPAWRQPRRGTLDGRFVPGMPTVVITHGWQPCSDYEGTPPAWQPEMRDAIRDRLARSGEAANLLTFTWPDAFTGSCIGTDPATVLANLWLDLQVASAYVPYNGQALGDALADQLEPSCRNTDCRIQLVGHSLGTLVNAEAAKVLTQRGIEVDQVTLLDPALGGTRFSEKDFRRLLPPYPAVHWVDNYIATEPIVPGAPVIGQPIPPAALDGGFSVPTDHLGIVDAYLDTIQQEAERRGFYYSTALAEAGAFLPDDQRPEPSKWLPVAVRPGLVSRLPGLLSDAVQTGWEVATGTVREELLSLGPIAVTALVLYEASDSAIELPVTIPDQADVLRFKLAFVEPGDGDWLTVSFDGDLLYSFRGDLFADSADPSNPQVVGVEIPLAGLQGSSGDLEVRLNSTGVVNAVFGVSDFELVELRDNRLPTADAGADQTVAADAECTGTVALDGTASSDPDGDALSFLWTAPDGTTATGSTPMLELPLGKNVVTLMVDDGYGATASDQVTVIVEDTSPPTIQSTVSTPAVLWPGDHTMRSVAVAVEAEDNCTAEPVCELTGISSDEPVTGHGTGATTPDWQTLGPLEASLRAERSGQGDGRTYTLAVTCQDEAGNPAESTALVEVPHDQGQ